MRRLPLLFALPLALTLWLYWPILRLPNVYDTLLHIQIAHGLGWWEAWLPTPQFGYFRPLVFVPLVTVREVWGGYPAAVLQAINLLQHSLNVGLVGWLVWRLWRDERQAVTAALLFATFPFSYQALAIYGNNVHLTILNFVLLGLLGVVRYWEVESRGAGEQGSRGGLLFLAVGVCFGGALLTHESSVVFVPLVGLLFLAWRGERPLTLRFILADWRWWMLAAVTALYLFSYWAFSLGTGPQAVADGRGWPEKLLLFEQVLAYPITIWAHRLPDVPAATLIGAGVVFMLGWAVWSAVRHPVHRCPLVFGLGWWLGVAVVMAVPLPTFYVATSARLHYFGGAGLAIGLLWLLESVWGTAAWRKVAWTAVLLAILLPSGWFVRQMLDLYGRASTPFAQVGQLAAEWPAEEGVVLVNWPQWVALPRNVFPVGADFAPVLGGHILPQGIVEGNLGRDRAPTTIVVEPSLLSETTYPYAIYELLAAPLISPTLASTQHVLLTRYEVDGPTAVHTGWLDYAPQNAPPPLAVFGPLELLSAELVGCETAVPTTRLVWRPVGELPATLSLFVQVLGADGTLIGQADGPPLGLPPTRYHLTPALQLHDQREIPLAAEGTAVQLLVGAYDYTTGERFAAVDGAGAPLADHAWRVECGEEERGSRGAEES